MVLDGNPLDDIRHTNTVRFVMKNGRLYDGDTLDEIYPTARTLELPVYADGEPATAAGIRQAVGGGPGRPEAAAVVRHLAASGRPGPRPAAYFFISSPASSAFPIRARLSVR